MTRIDLPYATASGILRGAKVNTMSSAERLEALLRQSPMMCTLFDRWAAVALPDAWLVAGAVAQTVWNIEHGRDPDAGIKDIDIVYFDADDLSAEAEAAQERRIAGMLADLAMKIDVKNEARVHLWYGRVFGREIPPYTSTADAIATFPTTATSVGVRPGADGRLEVAAPFGLDDLLGMQVRPNRALVSQAVYEAKTARWQHLWPRLAISGWN